MKRFILYFISFAIFINCNAYDWQQISEDIRSLQIKEVVPKNANKRIKKRINDYYIIIQAFYNARTRSNIFEQMNCKENDTIYFQENIRHFAFYSFTQYWCSQAWKNLEYFETYSFYVNHSDLKKCQNNQNYFDSINYAYEFWEIELPSDDNLPIQNFDFFVECTQRYFVYKWNLNGLRLLKYLERKAYEHICDCSGPSFPVFIRIILKENDNYEISLMEVPVDIYIEKKKT